MDTAPVIQISPAWLPRIRAAADDAALGRVLAELAGAVLATAGQRCIEIALAEHGRVVAQRAAETVRSVHRAAYKAGFADGRRLVSIDVDAAQALGAALGAAMGKLPAPTVSVAPAQVTVENTIEAPSMRPVHAKPDGRGGVIMTPVDE